MTVPAPAPRPRLFEVAQYVLAVGASDVTDVVGNTAGGLTGLGVVALARLTGRPPGHVAVGRRQRAEAGHESPCRG